MSYTIDSSIPVPPKAHGGGRNMLYPWDKLQVGDSIFKARAKPSFHGSAYQYARKRGFAVTARGVVEDGVKGTRVWRTA